MDPYRVRTAARLSGLVLLIGFGLITMWMQQTLGRMKQTRSGGVPVADRNTVRGRDALEAARNVVGPDAVVASAMDLNGDGAEERTVYRPLNPGQSLERSWLVRVAVLSPEQGESWRILFDTNRTADMPPLPSAMAVWRGISLSPNAIELENDAPETPLRVRFSWNGTGYSIETKTEHR